ncbi:hypothetical protein D9757_009344 [Collybiopsis confluens]|uniref:Uncharacterized protein n=1 Tax=Collybiopsis confluens TaxID=2823264 RepID=A0A8H5H3U1_9AGAR|nr:hypothetical protein D9757_009344 [Collybiopsis confluens]
MYGGLTCHILGFYHFFHQLELFRAFNTLWAIVRPSIYHTIDDQAMRVSGWNYFTWLRERRKNCCMRMAGVLDWFCNTTQGIVIIIKMSYNTIPTVCTSYMPPKSRSKRDRQYKQVVSSMGDSLPNESRRPYIRPPSSESSIYDGNILLWTRWMETWSTQMGGRGVGRFSRCLCWLNIKPVESEAGVNHSGLFVAKVNNQTSVLSTNSSTASGPYYLLRQVHLPASVVLFRWPRAHLQLLEFSRHRFQHFVLGLEGAPAPAVSLALHSQRPYIREAVSGNVLTYSQSNKQQIYGRRSPRPPPLSLHEEQSLLIESIPTQNPASLYDSAADTQYSSAFASDSGSGPMFNEGSVWPPPNHFVDPFVPAQKLLRRITPNFRLALLSRLQTVSL